MNNNPRIAGFRRVPARRTGSLIDSRRRSLVQAAAAAALVTGLAPLVCPSPARAAAKRTLRILQWNHFVPGYDKWFDGTYVKEWGQRHDTEVIVDHVGIPALATRAAAEVSAQKGHDLFMFLSPPPVYEEQVIDHREIYEECQRKHGKPVDLAVRSTYNPKTRKYFAFSDSFVPDPVNYRKDLWDEAGLPPPDSWDDVLNAGRKIKQTKGIPVGIGLSAELDTAMAMRTILYAFGGSVQDAHGNVVLNSPNTLESVKFVRALYRDAMTPEVLAWDPSSNNRAMLAGKISLCLNAISITREGENKNIPVTPDIWLTQALRGPAQRICLEHVMDCYVIWKFAENIAGAKQFLVDYIDNFRQGFLGSEFYNFPCFPSTVPDLKKLIDDDAKAKPRDKYKVLGSLMVQATNVGYPGYANAAIDEIFNTWVLNTMFARAATGDATPEDAIRDAEAACKRIFAKWQARGLV
ncbi:sugar ABC transporter substrate-binding protein [Burkholderia ubonensis]|uniref:Sugar ABC transporter substrate-binding protein n=1 Tax=Burkholderia ubonensis TaxID=101571 RepID=A0ABD4DU86_9BURK|nr:extracellular solute-binding protein [Burkholderia ubonensis]KVN76162.1 sugar ABC transporter substrate-binding protein [Burkholderia ubonensis]KVO91322.1 sugar ABC transporter substrate-binding protein [Burkholderia ubonensis]KVQ99316.1 sugar ABC transporter substrate-binding protein [Burkholderia ubonensis]KVR33476.1 sugar ABC transporter substrate-binding protein [Burkholderia ubonensis]KVU98391.1 sugar ABC transporter substrate-binding protein [Burkholderia ubonensis]